MKTQLCFMKILKGLFIIIVAFHLPLSLQAQNVKNKSAGKERHSVSNQAAKPKRDAGGNNQRNVTRSKTSGDNSSRADKSNVSTRNTKNISTGDKTNVSGNKVNVNRREKNVNINVDNSKNISVNNNRNTVVRRNSRPYGRPPYVHGGRRYYCYHPYHYHPYHPYHWGPVWHPWGFFVATIAKTAVIVAVESQQYHYDQGVYYISSNGGYTVVQAPVGATITTLPANSQTIVVNETTNNYYYGGAYYEKSSEGYTVVAPTAGSVVENLSEGGEEVKIGEIAYVKIGETYYQPIEQDGKNMYEVVQIEEGEESN
ncbi:MAG: hypothetical protein IPN67_15835 [Bacteroidales bacterium]|nr:hypothetical protein [Bacteroidales bacterium]